MNGRSHDRKQAGQGLVEFALVFPIIVLLIFAVVDIGRAVYAYNTITNAARQGARVAAVNQVDTTPPPTVCREDMPVEDPSNPDWSARACAAAAGIALGISPSAVSVTYTVPSGGTMTCSSTVINVGCIATVTVTYSWSPITPIAGSLIGAITMQSTSQIPVERVFP